MALTINNFWGAETGGLEECSAVTGSASVSAGSALSGGYGYDFGAVNQTYSFSPFESVADAGNGYICGFKLYATDFTTANDQNLLSFVEGASICGSFNLLANGNLQIRNANTVTIRTLTTPFDDGAEHLIEIYWQHSSSGTIEMFIDGVSQGIDTGQDLTDGGTFDTIQFQQNTNGPTGGKIDDIYFMSGATSSADRLGGCEVFAYRSSKASATPDTTVAGWTIDLHVGNWADAQEVLFSDSNWIEYNESTVGRGMVTCDDVGGSAGTGGPNTDDNVDGDIKAAKGIWRMKRDGGSGTTHWGALGKRDYAFPQQTPDLDPTTSYANYFGVWDSGEALPTTAFYSWIGISKSAGGQRFACSAMLAQILHVPTPESASLVYNFRNAFNHMLLR